MNKLTFLSWGGIIVLAVIIAVVGIDIANRASNIASHRQELQFRKSVANQLSTLKKEYNQAKSGIVKLNNFFTSQSDLEQFPDDLKKIATKSGVQVTSFAPQQIILPENSSPGRLIFALKLDGSYTKLLDFFQALKASRYPIALTSIELFRKGRGRREFTASLVGEVFFR